MKKLSLGLRTVVYKVTDLQKAKAWYADAFGVNPYFDEPFYVGFNIGGYELGLLPQQKTMNEKAEGGIAYWGVENIEESYQKLIEKGALSHQEPQNVGGPIIVASIKDPWGNIIGLIYNPVFKIEEE